MGCSVSKGHIQNPNPRNQQINNKPAQQTQQAQQVQQVQQTQQVQQAPPVLRVPILIGVNPFKKPEFSLERVQQANQANKHYEPLEPKLIDSIQKEMQWKVKVQSGQVTCQDYNARGNYLKGQKRIKEAIMAFGLAWQADPSDVGNLTDLSFVLRDQELWPLLIEVDHAICKRKPGDPIALFHLAADLLACQRNEEAIVYLYQLIGISPNHDQAYGLLGIACMGAGKHIESLYAFQMSAKQHPENPLSHNNIGAALSNLGRTEEAIVSYQQAVKLDPNLFFSLRPLGSMLQEKGRNEEAIPILQKVVEMDPEDGKALISLGTALGAVGKVAEGKEAMMKAIRLKIKDPAELARIEEQFKNVAYLERVEKANQANKHYEPLQPKLIDTIQKEIQWKVKTKNGPITCQEYNTRAKDLKAQGRPKEAIIAFGQAFQADPSNVDNLYDLTSLLRKEKEYEMLIEFDHAICRRQPCNADALFYLAADLQSCQRSQEAIAYLYQAINLNPNHTQAYGLLGVACLGVGRHIESLHAFQVSAKQHPEKAISHNNIGAALTNLGRTDEAILAFQHAVKLDPNLFFALRPLGCMLQEKGRNEEAIPILEKVVEMDPEDGEVLISLGSALGAMGRIEEGKEMLMRSIRLKITDPVELAKIEEQVKHIKA